MPLDSTNYLAPDTETKPIFSLEGLIAWLELQPPERPYDFYAEPCEGGCLFHRYLIAHNLPPVGKEYKKLGGLFGGRILEFAVARDGEQTFGAALDRARALLASRNR